MKLLKLRKGEYVFLGLSAFVTLTLTLWFPFPSYYIVTGSFEQLEIDLDEAQGMKWNLGSFGKSSGGPLEKLSADLSISSKSKIRLRRISKGQLEITIIEGSHIEFIKPKTLIPKKVPETELPMTLIVDSPLFDSSNLVLPISGNLVVGRTTQFVQSTSRRPMIREGKVEIQARAIDGRSVVETTDQKLYPADSLNFVEDKNGNGILILSEDPAIQVFYSVNASKAQIFRYGVDTPIVLKTSFSRRITTDPVIGTVWAGFTFLAGAMLFRRAQLEKKK